MIMDAEKFHGLPSTSCYQENQCYSFSQTPRPENQQNPSPRAEKDKHISSNREKIYPFSTFLFYSNPQRTECCSLMWMRVIFTPSRESNANLFWTHPLRHTQKIHSPIDQGLHYPSKLDT